VLSVDEDAELVEIEYLDGDIEELDLDAWHEMDLEKIEEPEGWAGGSESTMRPFTRSTHTGSNPSSRTWDRPVDATAGLCPRACNGADIHSARRHGTIQNLANVLQRARCIRPS